ncbi:helix-turn-helix transcriptional regulator [bacterium]|nr:helix-turn-helix transcriptional regulator [bacterium]MBP9806851.1 helix-turn-helix transcriptional regulator [bacterium]
MNKYIRTNLPALRFNNGRLSQKAVSEATGIGQKTLSALETGTSKGIEFNTLVKLCTFFDCTPSDLLTIEQEIQEDILEEPASPEARRQAKLLIAQGLEAALALPPATAEEIWTKFDAVRLRIQDELEKQASLEQASLQPGANKQPRKRA